MRKAVATVAILVFLVAVSGCDARQAELGTVQGLVVLSPACPVEMSPLPPPPGSPTPSSPDDTCGGLVSGATVKAFKVDSDEVAASVPTEGDGRFECELPAGDYRFEAVPASPAQGHGVPLDVGVEANSTVEVTLRISTGVQ